MMTSQTSRGFQ